MKNLLPHGFRFRTIWSHAAMVLFVLQLLLMLGSWLLAATIPASGIHSMLTSEGIRWFMGHYVDLLQTPFLVWIVLLSMAYGTLRDCGLLERSLPSSLSLHYRKRRAQLLTLLLLAVYVGIMLLLTVVPHAILLSATGSLWPSPFSASLIPVIAFGVTTLSAFYGMMSGRFADYQQVYTSLLGGIGQSAPLLLFYVLLMQLYVSLCYILP